MNLSIDELLQELTLKEKASLCSGSTFWHTQEIERLGIPSIMVSDGPHGLRKQEGKADHVGLVTSRKATSFPTASASASSWDVDLIESMGRALGEECLQENVSVLLGPGINIKRSPLGGRNFEYISEDPFLSGQLGSAYVKGVQSLGIGTAVKHFAVNNQEYRRLTIESVVDERALREIYLSAFETIVKEAKPWTIMCAYNLVDGLYNSDNHRLLTQILKEEWGHKGIVMTDWGAMNDRVEAIQAGLELEMPSSNGINDDLLVDAVEKGIISEEELNKSVRRILELVDKASQVRKPDFKYNMEEHHDLARKIASQSAVLLKNEDNILPLKKGKKLMVIGEFARTPRYQGAGSSANNPNKLVSFLDALRSQNISYRFSKGYSIRRDYINEQRLKRAVYRARRSESVIIFAGLTDKYESEGFDRSNLSIPNNQLRLIDAVSKVNPNTIVILQNGAPIEMPWINNVRAVLECYLGGQAGGEAIMDVIYGHVNPSGKLTETFPLRLEDDLASKWFKMGPKTVEYRESIYVGYRYYDTFDIPVLFPFGYGLSYTTFEYRRFKLSKHVMKEGEILHVSFHIKNTGSVPGAEIAQLYVHDKESTIFRPKKELKGFKKIYLEVNEVVEVSFDLSMRAFAYYNTNIMDWHVESGEFQIMVGASSQDIRLSDVVTVHSNSEYIPIPDYRSRGPEYYPIREGSAIQSLDGISDESFKAILGREIPSNIGPSLEAFTINSTLEDIRITLIGKVLHYMVKRTLLKMIGDAEENQSAKHMLNSVVNDMPIRSIVLMGDGVLTYEMAEGLLLILNKHRLRGVSRFIQGAIKNKYRSKAE